MLAPETASTTRRPQSRRPTGQRASVLSDHANGPGSPSASASCVAPRSSCTSCRSLEGAIIDRGRRATRQPCGLTPPTSPALRRRLYVFSVHILACALSFHIRAVAAHVAAAGMGRQLPQRLALRNVRGSAAAVAAGSADQHARTTLQKTAVVVWTGPVRQQRPTSRAWLRLLALSQRCAVHLPGSRDSMGNAT
jgi:hypothetical protein